LDGGLDQGSLDQGSLNQGGLDHGGLDHSDLDSWRFGWRFAYWFEWLFRRSTDWNWEGDMFVRRLDSFGWLVERVNE
jgi:hypothetical protein